MDVVYARCCGIDIHKKSAVACVIVSQTKGPPHKEIRTFGTMTDELQALGDWLGGYGVSHVAMEASQEHASARAPMGRAVPGCRTASIFR